MAGVGGKTQVVPPAARGVTEECGMLLSAVKPVGTPSSVREWFEHRCRVAAVVRVNGRVPPSRTPLGAEAGEEHLVDDGGERARKVDVVDVEARAAAEAVDAVRVDGAPLRAREGRV